MCPGNSSFITLEEVQLINVFVGFSILIFIAFRVQRGKSPILELPLFLLSGHSAEGLGACQSSMLRLNGGYVVCPDVGCDYVIRGCLV